MRWRLTAVSGLVAANILFYLATYFVAPWYEFMTRTFALFFPQNSEFRWWQFITYMFMHGGITHILFNMFGLISFGPHLERIWGHRRFLEFYFICGLGAAAIYTAINWVEFNSLRETLIETRFSPEQIDRMLETQRYPNGVAIAGVRESVERMYYLYSSPMVGASGALYGVLVAFALMYPNAKLALLLIPVPISAKILIPVLLLFDLFSGVTKISIFGGGVAHFAHIGGAVIGFLLMIYWKRRLRPLPESFR